MLFRSAVSESVTNIEKLRTIEVKYPESAMKRVAKFCKLPKAMILDVIGQYVTATGGGRTNAMTCYLTLCNVIAKYEASQSHPRYRKQLENNVLKCMNIDWSKYDQPGFIW